MANERLNNFLIDDVTKLVAFINEHEEVQAIETPDMGYDTLGDFATYWSHHIDSLSK